MARWHFERIKADDTYMGAIEIQRIADDTLKDILSLDNTKLDSTCTHDGEKL